MTVLERAVAQLVAGLALTVAAIVIAAAGSTVGLALGTLAWRIETNPYGPEAWWTAYIALAVTGLLSLAITVHHTQRGDR